MTFRRWAGAVAFAALIAAAGCDKLFPAARSPFNAVDVTGAPMGGEFRLADHNGRPRTLADFRGKVVVLALGFTHCPDVCPTTLADFASALRRLGPDAQGVQVLFVTVDPERDSTAVLGEYVPAFHPSFVGLRGDERATRQLLSDFRLYAEKRPGKDPASYTVDHSAQSLVFDREGRLRLVIGYGMAPDKIAADLRILLNG